MNTMNLVSMIGVALMVLALAAVGTKRLITIKRQRRYDAVIAARLAKAIGGW
jgi:hypothetical protein